MKSAVIALGITLMATQVVAAESFYKMRRPDGEMVSGQEILVLTDAAALWIEYNNCRSATKEEVDKAVFAYSSVAVGLRSVAEAEVLVMMQATTILQGMYEGQITYWCDNRASLKKNPS